MPTEVWHVEEVYDINPCVSLVPHQRIGVYKANKPVCCIMTHGLSRSRLHAALGRLLFLSEAALDCMPGVPIFAVPTS